MFFIVFSLLDAGICPKENNINYYKPLFMKKIMENEYCPRKKEVLEEIVEGIKENFSKENVKNYSKDFAIGGSFAATSLFTISTHVRFYLQNEGRLIHTCASRNGLTSGAGVVAGLGISAMINDLCFGSASGADYVPIFLVTNAASGIYEIGMAVYSNAKRRAITKHPFLKDKLD